MSVAGVIEDDLYERITDLEAEVEQLKALAVKEAVKVELCRLTQVDLHTFNSGCGFDIPEDDSFEGWTFCPFCGKPLSIMHDGVKEGR